MKISFDWIFVYIVAELSLSSKYCHSSVIVKCSWQRRRDYIQEVEVAVDTEEEGYLL